MPNDRLSFFKNFTARSGAGPLSAKDFESRAVLIAIKRALFERVNEDRRAHGFGRVAYDRLAAEVGEAHCREMLARGYVSHWNTRGLKPYHRFARAGGTDGLSENVAGADATGDIYGSVEEVAAGVLESHEAMLAEVPPHDGHRRTILNPAQTHVGIGLAFNRRGFRMTQEFLQRYVRLDSPPPRSLPPGAEFTLRGRALDPAHKVQNVAVFYEPMPRPLSSNELQQTGSYGFPSEVTYEHPVCPPGMRYADGGTGTLALDREGRFACAIKFKRGRPGLYTVCVWLRDARGLNIPATNITLNVG